MLNQILRLIKRVAFSRAGQILFAAHSLLVIYEYYERSFSTIPYHFTYESILHKTLVLINLPNLLISIVLTTPFSYVNSPLHHFWWANWITLAILFVCASAQWLLVGYWIEFLYRKFQPKIMA
jgi:hypothetical protein